MRKKANAIFRLLLLTFAWISTLIFFAWSLGALWFFELLPPAAGRFLATGLLVVAILWWMNCRPRHRWMLFAGTAIGLIWLLTLFQQPTHDRRWAKDQTELSTVEFEGGTVTIKNFRNSKYRSESDFDVVRNDFQFRLEDLNKMWFIVQRFSPSEGMAHVFLSFEIAGGSEKKYFSVSVEIRRESDEYYSPIQGLYRQYELNYIFGSEQDLIGVRTVMRPEDRVFLYLINANPSQVQKLFLSIADRCNRIQTKPEFYHTLLNNCMNGILRHTRELTDDRISWFDPQIVFPGYSDRYAWREGFIGRPDQSFEQLKRVSRIDGLARKHGLNPDFSSAIRTRANTD